MNDTLKIIDGKEPWYAKGLQFKCTQCGRCCTGAPGYIWVDESEILTLAAYLNMEAEEFAEKYLREINGRYSLKEMPKTYDCVFLKNNKCSVYSARPKQCRTFPWWPANLKSKQDWNEASKYCEGINHPEAPSVEYSVIKEQLEIHLGE